MIRVAVQHRLGSFDLNAQFESDGRVTALFGRSGSGKTSLVNAIGGLIRPACAHISLDGEILVDTEQRVFVAKHRRRVAYVFQDARLFPHLTVRQNLLYGRWFTPPAKRFGQLAQVVELLGIGHLLQRRPRNLSGGEKQRVAIGRALLASPRLLIMDEPLASLDEARKAEILPYLERLYDETKVPTIYVSHSVLEVARLADTLVVMAEGRVEATGPTADVMARLDLPPFTDLIEAGAVLEAEILKHDDSFGLTVLSLCGSRLWVPRLDRHRVGAKVRVHIRARDVMLSTRPPDRLSALNVLRGTIAEIGPQRGPIRDVRLDCSGQAILARITRRSVESLHLTEGTTVYAVIKAVGLDRQTFGAASRHANGADTTAIPI
ncbi:molybdenum ABC transporter ATP-binding protein [Bradyrhizobium centrolobii]|uniref:Molybdenum ABC transporter ATP-binding protein n=1 Tax=Bradyrhizobium centrolobii TaxID=1505087 RepID=A0A176YIR7_9BRAD|nr:molybdenum ABC transporter ATP-binding protein [Bradyrhizobium centrolobii]OAF05785.1 molybdenum ABC transporter ATP-binding protein [Bradyrhizobium centrolobii]